MKDFCLSLACLSLLIAPSLAAAADPPRPNVVLVFIDDMGYGDIAPFGNKQWKTPHLDKLAAEGMKFTSFYATPVCSMSRACLLTGCYNVRVSVPGVYFPNIQKGLHPDEVTLAEIVKPQGYAAMCIGKWHLGHRDEFLPTSQGFDAYFGIPYSNDMTIDPKHARLAGDCVFREGLTADDARSKTARNKVPLMRGREVIEYPADQSTLTKRYTEEAVKFIRSNKDKPFFLYLPHTMVHYPLAASEAFRGKSGGGLLGDAIEEIDWSMGQIMGALREAGIDSKTLVIFTSDNGAAAGSSAPWRGKKGSIYEGGVREPCIMRWPGRIPAGTTCPQIAGNIDMLPTLAALVGTPLPQGHTLDGRDIRSLMFTADAQAVRDTHLYYTRAGQLGAIRQGDWKLVLADERPKPRKTAKNDKAPKTEKKNQPAKAARNPLPFGPALFNLAKDPGETTDVSAENAELVARLKAETQRRDQEIRQNRRPEGVAAPDTDAKKKE